MSDQTQSSNQRMIVIALAVVAVLLAALVGVLIYQQSQAAKTAQLGAPAPAVQTPAGTAPTTPFDAKTATPVPAGTTPEAFLKAYHEDVIAGKYDTAYKMLPLDGQKKYGDAASYASQLKLYSISGYKLGKPVETADTISIPALMENPSMPITYTWNFKKVGDTWYVESRVTGGTVE